MKAIARKTPPAKAFATPRKAGLFRHLSYFVGIRPEISERKNIPTINGILS
jgi:hypothetical protein